MGKTKKFYVNGTAYDVPISGQSYDHGMPESWVANAQAQYGAMTAAMKEPSLSGVPFFIATDHHGKGTFAQQWLANTDPAVRSINLGDYSPDTFGPQSMAALAEQTAALPNYIGVPGNHDFKKNTENPANYFDINAGFRVDGGRRWDRQGYGTVKDEALNVKWLILQPYAIDLDTAAGFTTGLSTAQAQWLIRELSADDGYDVVILQHMPLYGAYTTRDGATAQATDFSACDITGMLKDRIIGEAGDFLDSDGVMHNYDFAGVRGRLLCTLHGHMHTEMWRISDGLVSYCAPGYLSDHACVFGLIDRLNGRLTVWRFDSETVYGALSLNISAGDK